ncbi:MAG: DUF1146 domain-containing protein [Erysipelotrichaceae bacterium]|nr:DUF1146 domain-containing protein [Erysipelotrichaceae bacterium]
MMDYRTLFYMKVLIQIICFIGAFYSLQAFNFEKSIKQGKVFQSQLLYIMLSSGLAYLVSQFIISMIYQLSIW